jgi:glyoxylase-like metal-dependent hydrolase (beta-lactamase superfamily II)
VSTAAKPPDTAQEWFEVHHVNELVTAIREPLHEQDVLSYCIRSGDEAVFIDAGMGFYPVPDVLEGVSAGRVLLTHCHWDHSGGAGAFRDVRIADHPFETERLSRGWAAGEMRQLGPPFFAGGLRPSWLSERSFTVPGIDRWTPFREGDRFAAGDESLRVIVTPGHTPGSACFLLERHGYLFTGDTLYPGPEYIHIVGADYAAYFRSLVRLWDGLGAGLRAIFPGHNAPVAHPDLLRRHAEAAAGRLPYRDVINDDAGRFVEYVWEATDTTPGFSFRLPPSFPGFG